MEENIIKIRCVECSEVRYVNEMLWDDGKIFKCDNCNGCIITISPRTQASID